MATFRHVTDAWFVGREPANRAAKRSPFWLMGLAAVCLLAQSTLLPIAAPSAAAWDPAHVHVSLSGVVPEHAHPYSGDEPRSQCAPSPAAADESSPAADRQVACGPAATGAISSVPAALTPASNAAVDLSGHESSTGSGLAAEWVSATLDVRTPPPRTA
ncbi:MAG: hypothetical protein AB7L91_01260 [Dehalococcoidia bacterium]